MKDAGATRFVDRHLCLGFMIDCIAHPEKNEKIGGVQGFYDGGRFTGGKEKEQRPEQPPVSIPLQVMSLWVGYCAMTKHCPSGTSNSVN